jgi:hypothetical protein
VFERADESENRFLGFDTCVWDDAFGTVNARNPRIDLQEAFASFIGNEYLDLILPKSTTSDSESAGTGEIAH